MTIARSASDGRLESRLKWIMSVRLGIALACLVAVFVLEAGGSKFVPGPPYLVLTLAVALNLTYMLAARLGADPRRQAVVQIATDVVLVTALAYLVGPHRLYAALYFAVVIGAAAALGLRTAVLTAILCSLCLGVISSLYHFVGEDGLPIVGRVALPDARTGFVAGYAAFYALGLCAVAVLSGKLAEEVSRVRILNEEILQNMAGGVVAVDRLGMVAYANAQARQMLGLTDGVGGEYARVMPREIGVLFHRALSGGERIKAEVVVGDRHLGVAIAQLEDGRRKHLRGVVGIVDDLSLRRDMEKKTEEAERFRALLEMSAGIAHEIRNPIASIRGAAQELGETSVPDGDERRLLEVVMRESDRLDKIITDFLEYASDRPMQTALINLSDLLAEVATLLETRSERRTPKIDLKTPRTLVCRGAPDKLKQVFLNLGVNAVEAMEGSTRMRELSSGKITIRCIAATAASGPARDGVLVEFEDDGPGIPREKLGRIFDPFFTTKPKGTGMGLAIARKIVQEHGGTIHAESLSPRGSRFSVWLPAE